MKYNEQDMAKLISEVETEFKEYLAKAEQSEVSDENIEVEAAASAEESAEEVSLEKNETEFDYDEEDIAEMNEMYSSMSKSEKEAHYSAIKTVLFGKSEESEESEDLNKSEEESQEAEANDEEKELLKSEVDSVKKENDELKKNIETLTNIVSKIVKKAPARKAVTQIGNIQVIKKSEEPAKEEENGEIDYTSMKKAEINKILSGKIRNGEIKKAEDKEKINQYCHGQIKIDEIKHLLK